MTRKTTQVIRFQVTNRFNQEEWNLGHSEETDMVFHCTISLEKDDHYYIQTLRNDIFSITIFRGTGRLFSLKYLFGEANFA